MLKNGVAEYQSNFDEQTKLDKVFSSGKHQYQNSYRLNSDLRPLDPNTSPLKLRNFWSYCNCEHELELEIRVTKFSRKFLILSMFAKQVQFIMFSYVILFLS